jgi:hypothetical protein
MAPFPFAKLSVELCLEIVRVAASPQFELPSTTPRSYYATAIALCSVSYRIRLATMPHLLRTVVLISSEDTHYFIQSIILQHSHRRASSRLALDYTKLVRRLWSAECWEPVADGPSDWPNYRMLYDIIRNVHTLGLDVYSQHLLYNGLASVKAHLTDDWKCRRLTSAGPFWRWVPFTSTPEGQAFLRQLTHLVLWIEDYCVDTNVGGSLLPSWLKNVPFKLMPALTHLAFLVLKPPPPSSIPDPATCRSWILSENDDAQHVKDMNIRLIISNGRPNEHNWALAFLQGKDEEIWATEHVSEQDCLCGPVYESG